jgi:hypothetical protein
VVAQFADHKKNLGEADSKLVIDGSEVVVFKSVRSAQPYKNIERFVAEDKVIGFVVNPGLLPIVKAISMDIRGRKMLVTRRIQAREDDKGVVAQLDHFGVRITMSFDPLRSEQTLFGKHSGALGRWTGIGFGQHPNFP